MRMRVCQLPPTSGRARDRRANVVASTGSKCSSRSSRHWRSSSRSTRSDARLRTTVTELRRPAAGDGSGSASADAKGDAAGADAGHSHDGDTADAAAAPTEEDFGLRDLENGQMTHDYGADQPLDTETRTELARQLSLTREVADKYPTLQSAVDSGRFRAGPFVPGLGTHMVGAGSFDPDGVIDDNDARKSTDDHLRRSGTGRADRGLHVLLDEQGGAGRLRRSE